MYKKIYLDCVTDENIQKACMEIMYKTVGDEEKSVITFKLGDLMIEKEADDFFNALILVRKELEPKNIMLLCKGSCKNIAPSRMSMDMGSGIIAYKMELGKQATERVNIFDGCAVDEYSTVSEQLEFIDQWYESLHSTRRK